MLYTPKSGIYCFENLLNGMKYIGQAQNLNKRIKKHLSLLRTNREECLYLQRAWNFYGGESFIIYIIEEVEVFLLNEKEPFYIKELKSHVTENGYNISWGGKTPMRGRKHSEETKRKMSESRSGEKNPNFGKPMSEEQKRKLSDGRLGNKHWSFGTKHKPETIEKMKKNNIQKNKGKTMPLSTRLKQSEKSLGKKKPKNSSTYKGISFHKASGKWRARIFENSKETYLGLFLSELDGAIFYDKYCWEKYKNLELLNFPERVINEEYK